MIHEVTLTLSESEGDVSVVRVWKMTPCQAARLAAVLGRPQAEVLLDGDTEREVADRYANRAVVVR